MEIIITEDHSFCGRDILSLLKAMGLSSKMIKYLKYRDDGILVNGARVTVRHVLTEKDNLCLALDDPDSADCTPIDIALDVIYENDDLIVINKPPFMPTHTSHGHYDDTLANALAGYFTKKKCSICFQTNKQTRQKYKRTCFGGQKQAIRRISLE